MYRRLVKKSSPSNCFCDGFYVVSSPCLPMPVVMPVVMTGSCARSCAGSCAGSYAGSCAGSYAEPNPGPIRDQFCGIINLI